MLIIQGKSSWKLVLIIVILVIIVAGGVLLWLQKEEIKNSPSPIGCTQEAKICPDGSAVGRTEPNCEFAKCPTISPPTECKKDSDCATGNLCHENVCVSPIGEECSGPSGTGCPSGYECIQGCGSPVGYPDEPPPLYFCQLQGYIRTCPICLAVNTLIDTPLGVVPIEQLEKGASIWTTNKSGERVTGIVVSTSKTPVALNHQMTQIIFDDGRKLLVSPGHPTIDGRTVGNLVVGDFYDDAYIITMKQVIYGDVATYDVLPSGETGFYWANDILLDSTLHF